MKFPSLSVVALLFGMVAAPAMAQHEPAAPAPHDTTAAKSTAKDTAVFLRKLHAINEAEIKVGNLAQQKGEQAAIKDYGQMLVSEHQALDKRVEDAAKTLKVDLTATSDKDVAKLRKNLEGVYDKLDKTTAAKFGDAFAKEMVKGHQEALDLTKKAHTRLDQTGKDLAAAAEPMLQKHLDHAKQLERGLAAH